MKVQCEYCDSYIEVDESYVCPNCGAPLGAAVYAAEQKAKQEAEETEARARAEAEAERQAAYAQAQAQRTQETLTKIVEGVVLGSIAAQSRKQQRTIFAQPVRPIQPQSRPVQPIRPAQPHQGGIFGGTPQRPTPIQPQRPTQATRPVQPARPTQAGPIGFGKPSSGPASRPGSAPGTFGSRTRSNGSDKGSSGPKGRR